MQTWSDWSAIEGKKINFSTERKQSVNWTSPPFCSLSSSGCWFTATPREPSERAATSCRPLRYSQEQGFTLSVCGGWCCIHVFSLKFRAIEFPHKTKKQQKTHRALRLRQSQECNKYFLERFLVRFQKQLDKSVFGGGVRGELFAVNAGGGKMLMAFWKGQKKKKKRKSGQIKSARS